MWRRLFFCYASEKKHHHVWDGLVVENGAVCPHQELDYDEPIGQGSFGTVYKGTYHLFPYDRPEQVVEVAVKNVNDCHSSHNELATLVELKEEKEVVHLYNYYEEDNHALFVTELCRGGDLIGYMKQRDAPLSEDEARPIIRWLLHAIRTCHAHKICHADLKLDNIGLVRPNDLGALKLLDFGRSKRMDQASYTAREIGGSMRYLAPELFRQTALGDISPIDLWCAGIIMYSLLHNQFPFGTTSEIVSRQLVFEGSKACADLQARLLDKDPATRITVEEALEHRWFNKATF